MVFFRGVPAHLVDLRMDAAIKLNGQSVFEAVEIQENGVTNCFFAPRRTRPLVGGRDHG
jgi:hypothetical protein